MRLVIYDLDNTVIDSNHRYRNLPNGSIDLPYWKANCTPQKVALDKLLPRAQDYKRALENKSVFVVIATARELAQADLAYIKDKLGMPNHIISRKADDDRPDWVLKVAGLRRLFGLRQFKPDNAVFYDDNKHNIKAVSELGVTCVQC